MKALLDWLDDRTGCRKLVHEALYERIPGGARWRYVWGSTLVFAFVTQLLTGVFLWMAYSPSAQTAWESVYFIQYEMQGGWLLRGIHHFMAQAMVVLLALHLFQVVIDGAYRAPREVNFWLGLILMKLVLGLALTGYLLPWDKKGYWATSVATSIMGQTPVAGAQIQTLVVGGTEYGHHTLTRFFALHAGVLPGLLIAVLVLHLALFRRHGICHKQPHRRQDCYFWPDQVLKDGVACLAVLGLVLFLVFYLGVELGPPADAAQPYDAARPEWYFLFLFQLLKLFEGDLAIIGTMVIPGLVVTVLFLMPIIGRWQLGHRFNVAFIFGLLLAVVVLTAIAVRHDQQDEVFKQAVAQTHREGLRVVELASRGIPPEGALFMMRRDPLLQGEKLFAEKCAACHRHTDAQGSGIAAEEPSAPNLYGFGSRAWLRGLFDPQRFASADYFGKTKHLEEGMMRDVVEGCAAADEAQRQQLEDILLAVSAEAALPYQAEEDQRDAARIEAGRKLLEEGAFETANCVDCHNFRSAQNDGGAPDLTGWGSETWLVDFIANPAHPRFYGESNDRMPAFAEQLSPEQLRLIARWLRQDWPRGRVEAAEAH